MKICPFCAEEIQDAAIVCKHCGRDLNTGTLPAAAPPKRPGLSPVAKIIGVLLLVIALGFVGVMVVLIAVLWPNSHTSQSDSTPRQAPLRLEFFVRPEVRALRVTNDSASALTCDVTIDGGFTLSHEVMVPKRAEVLSYDRFGGLDSEEGYSRAQRGVHIECTDSQGRSASADYGK